MKLYQCNPTGEFLKEVKARENPLEQGKYLIPAGCTTIKPPAISEKEVAVFDKNKGQWIVVENHRGEKFYNKETKEEFIIETIGKIPSEFFIAFTDKKPSEDMFIVWKEKDWGINEVAKEADEIERKINNLREKKVLESLIKEEQLTTKEIDVINSKIAALSTISEDEVKT